MHKTKTTKKMKAVIIDDEKRTRELIAKMIESFGLGIETFPIGESVESGLKAIESEHPDTVSYTHLRAHETG
jgi:two-component system LytT family response regulator